MRQPAEVHAGALTTEVRSCLGSLAPKAPLRRAESANWEATFVYELQSNLLEPRGYAKRCENARGSKRETGEPHRYHGCKFGTGVNVVLDNYLQTKRGVIE